MMGPYSTLWIRGRSVGSNVLPASIRSAPVHGFGNPLKKLDSFRPANLPLE